LRNERFFDFGEAIYDRDNPKRRAWFGGVGGHGPLANIVKTMNDNDTDYYSLHWTESHEKHTLSTQTPWAPASEFVSEYDLAVNILGEDYFA